MKKASGSYPCEACGKKPQDGYAHLVEPDNRIDLTKSPYCTSMLVLGKWFYFRYLVTNKLWRQACEKLCKQKKRLFANQICLRCLRKLIGRPFVLADFPKELMNKSDEYRQFLVAYGNGQGPERPDL